MLVTIPQVLPGVGPVKPCAITAISADGTLESGKAPELVWMERRMERGQRPLYPICSVQTPERYGIKILGGLVWLVLL